MLRVLEIRVGDAGTAGLVREHVALLACEIDDQSPEDLPAALDHLCDWERGRLLMWYAASSCSGGDRLRSVNIEAALAPPHWRVTIGSSKVAVQALPPGMVLLHGMVRCSRRPPGG